ncbi:DUF2986 domain-containing protein [Marinomonas pontica]|uniref:DUF2986 domain-containing protein n=1 Tax=Marinomonas pontica TaxID=264739 RepID=UPI002242EB41|nr:DUF2986 domain-containing protein [Marinomonas pontica]MCW8357516.1 DUF2986 domain-containing protein [Marinomonas pontica]
MLLLLRIGLQHHFRNTHESPQKNQRHLRQAYEAGQPKGEPKKAKPKYISKAERAKMEAEAAANQTDAADIQAIETSEASETIDTKDA